MFRATVELLKESGKENLLEETYHKCKTELEKPKTEMQNAVRDIYRPFTVDEINNKMIEMLRPEGMNRLKMNQLVKVD